MTLTASTASVASMTSTASFHQKKITYPDDWIIPSTQMIKTRPFLWNGSLKIQFSTDMIPFLSEAVEASPGYFFENWFMNLKFPNLLKPLGTTIQQNY